MKALFLFLLLILPVQAAELEITKEFCDKYVIDHQAAEDVAYNPADQKFGPPADLNGAIRIQVPKSFKIPVQVDLTRYLGVPPKVTDQNHKTLTTNLANLSTLNNQLVARETAIAAQQSSINNANTAIQAQLNSATPNTATLNTSFTQAITNIQSAINFLNQNRSQIQQATTTITTNTNILKKQFNQYEQDAVVLDKNKTFKDSTSASLTANQGHVSLAAQQLTALENSLNSNISLLSDSPLTFQTTTSYAESLNQLRAQLQTTKQNIAGLSTDQTQLTKLAKQVSALDNTKVKPISYADLGNIEVNLDGRIYFNGQPLYKEEEYRIKQACKQLRTQN